MSESKTKFILHSLPTFIQRGKKEKPSTNTPCSRYDGVVRSFSCTSLHGKGARGGAAKEFKNSEPKLTNQTNVAAVIDL